jgi:hypothetical protein
MSDRTPRGYDECTESEGKNTDSTVTETVEGIPLVPQPSRKVLNPREQVDYAEHRRDWLRWTLSMGKDTNHFNGYSTSTMKSRAARVDRFFFSLAME